jgi:adenylyltransferase/sulfurtransferase
VLTEAVGREAAELEALADQIAALNPEVRVTPLGHHLQGDELDAEIRAADLVVDCSDNFATRFALNRACIARRTPLVSGAAMRFEGQVTVFLNTGDGPCYQCLYKDDGEQGDSCSRIGVLAPLVGVIGSLQAVEVIKVLTGAGETLSGSLLLFDALGNDWRKLRLRRDPDCPACGNPPETLST